MSAQAIGGPACRIRARSPQRGHRFACEHDVDEQRLGGEVAVVRDAVGFLDAGIVDQRAPVPARRDVPARGRRQASCDRVAAGADDVVGEARQADVDDLEVRVEQLVHGRLLQRAARRLTRYAAHSAASALLEATSTPADCEPGDDLGAVLRIGVGAADVADERDVASRGLAALRARPSTSSSPRSGRRPSRSRARRRRAPPRSRVGGLVGDALVAQRRVDHRVRPALGELVVAHVDDGVLRLTRMSSSARLPATGVLDELTMPARLADQLRLEAERAAAEDAAHEALARRHAPRGVVEPAASRRA